MENIVTELNLKIIMLAPLTELAMYEVGLYGDIYLCYFLYKQYLSKCSSKGKNTFYSTLKF